MQKAHEQLLALKKQQEQIEKQKRELQKLSRRQEELERGRAEMLDKLSPSLVVLEREGYDSQKGSSKSARRTRVLLSIYSCSKGSNRRKGIRELPKRLSRALSTVDDARTEFSQQRSRLDAGNSDQSADLDLPESRPVFPKSAPGNPFAQWIKIAR